MRRRTRVLVILAAGTVALLAVGEGVSRWWLGLGTPLLYVEHPRVEYMLRPNQDRWRFGNHLVINEHGMRSPPLAPHKASPDDVRVLVFGDSIVNGGGHIDQTEVVTTLLAERLAGQVAPRKLEVANVSAGSWGPGNWLAYLREFGSFDADLIVLVLSSHDHCDNPTFTGLNTNLCPDTDPPSALAEVFFRYLPRYARRAMFPRGPEAPPTQADIDRAMTDLAAFLELAKASAPEVIVFQAAERIEAQRDESLKGHGIIRAVCDQAGVPTYDFRGAMAEAIRKGTPGLYQDFEHPGPPGHKVMADVMEPVLRSTRALSTTPTPAP